MKPLGPTRHYPPSKARFRCWALINTASVECASDSANWKKHPVVRGIGCTL